MSSQDCKDRIISNLEAIQSNIETVAGRVNRDHTEIMLLPVTKKRSEEEIRTLMSLGRDEFGESYTEEIVRRFPVFPEVKWHFIGHLHRKHTNKIVGNVVMIHSVANERLLRKVDFTAGQKELKQRVLLEVNVSGEEVKQGFTPADVEGLYRDGIVAELPNIHVMGLMTMAPFVTDEAVIRPVFRGLRELLGKLNAEFKAGLRELSMGMTNDYEIAVEEGATIVRIGTAIFE
jgi:pyridoxal phosphate enzyme (YggS family)